MKQTSQDAWDRARALLQPRSHLGWLFGVTQKDIDHAVEKLRHV